MTMTRQKLSLVAQFDDLQRNSRVLTQGIETGLCIIFCSKSFIIMSVSNHILASNVLKIS